MQTRTRTLRRGERRLTLSSDKRSLTGGGVEAMRDAGRLSFRFRGDRFDLSFDAAEIALILERRAVGCRLKCQ